MMKKFKEYRTFLFCLFLFIILMIYEWKVAAMLPTLIPYQNIQSIQKKSKHHIIVEHQKTSHIYVFNSDAFLKAYNDFTQEDKTNENE